MAISDLATEFAGLPVVEYHPAVGLVFPTMPRREFRPSAGGALWAIRLERDRVVVESSTAKENGTRTFPDAAAARAAYRDLIVEKLKAGYAEQPRQAGSLREVLAAAIIADPDDAASRMAFADYLAEQGEEFPAVAYRVGKERWDAPILPRLEAFLADPAAWFVPALVIGFWGTESDEGPEEEVQALIAARHRLPNLRAIFLGDVPYTDNEISWLVQGDLTDLILAFPKLEHFKARGGGGLVLREFRHEHLKSLAFEASNLPREVVRVVGACDLPALEHLELWLGTDEYGADTEVSDLADIFAGKRLPALRRLGIRNSEIADDVAAAVATAPILDRLETLDLSLGTLSDRGAEALLASPGVARLKALDIHHHYVSTPLVERLRALGIEVNADEARESEDEGGGRYVAHAE